jgi:hypothetical protein
MREKREKAKREKRETDSVIAELERSIMLYLYKRR